MNHPSKNKIEDRPRTPTTFWYVISCLAFSLLFLLFQGGKLASMLFVVVSMLSIYLLLGKWSGISKAQGTRVLSGTDQDIRLDAGQSLRVQLQFHIPGIWPIPYVMVKDRIVRQNGEEVNFEGSLVPDWRRRGEFEYSTPPLKRGYYQFSETECATEDMFGLFQHSGRLEMRDHFAVLPQTVAIKEWVQFHQMLKGMQHHSASTRAHRETTQINGVREFIYGDRLSRIHWNATARTGTWKSKEFERESLPKTIILLDRTQRAYGDPNDFELAVSVAASLFRFSSGKELALGLLSVGSESSYYEPKQSHSHHKTIINHLIGVEADGFHPLLQIVKDRSRQLAPGSFFVVVSPQKGTAMMQILHWLDQHQMNPCHIWINPAVPHANSAPQDGVSREDWMKQVRARGYMGYDISSLTELPDLLGGAKRYA